MATINLGQIKFNWRGAYSGATAYVVDDVVSYNGSSYVCILASTGNLPTDTTYWNVMAEGGDVATVLTTQGDILYRDGSGLQRLGAGTSGQVLQSGGTGANVSWTDVSGGIENYTEFRVTTDFTFTANDAHINTNLSTANTSLIGTAVTESSGTFSFPQTGYWKVETQMYTVRVTGTTAYIGNIIKYTGDNSNYSNVARLYSGFGNTSNEHGFINVQAVLGISDISNQKIRWHYETSAPNGSRASCSSSEAKTCIRFTRLADV